MIELRNYFCETCYKHEYYLHKFERLYTWDGLFDEFWVVDEQDAIEKFKELVQPYNPSNPMFDSPKDDQFIYLCNYLNDVGYYIKEFPNFLERPTDRFDFSYNKIRGKIIEQGGNSARVFWSDRRAFIDKMRFVRSKNYNLTNGIDNILKTVSTRGAEFVQMSHDEKLEAICNSIEFLLKPNSNSKRFVELDYSDSEGFLRDELVKEYRNKMQCFRHSTNEDIERRKKYSNDQKELFINYGLTILDYLFKKTK